MATLNFIRGTIRGRLGQFVGSSWKGKSYIKTFTKPGNPKTAEQMAVRTVFQNVGHIAKGIYDAILKPYTFPKPRRMTAYNRMIQANQAMFDGKEWDPEKLKIFEGPLHNPGITGVTVSGDTAVIAFDASGGDPNDKALGIVFDAASGAVVNGQVIRDAGGVSVPLGTIDTGAADLHAYLVFSREPVIGTSEKGQVSNTAHYKV